VDDRAAARALVEAATRFYAEAGGDADEPRATELLTAL
jgi:hypothetical protein